MVLENFFNPKTIAIIGASDHPGKVGGILMEKASKSQCKLVPVNKSHDFLFGQKCYKSILDYKEKIDLAVIAIPGMFVAPVLEECGKKGIKSVIIISAGFSEIGNLEAENKLKEIIKKYEIRVLGPNCFGVYSPIVDLTFAKNTPKKGKIAFISQSGALWSYLADLELGFSGFVGLGNMADLEFSDFIEHFLKDKETQAIILYIEKVKDGKRFLEVCKRAKKENKKIFAIKAGISKEGEKAAFSHTASIASDYLVYRGAFKQAGVELCKSLEEAIEKAKKQEIFHKEKNLEVLKEIRNKKVGIITNAGGAGALFSDYISEACKIIGQPQDILGTALAEDYLKALKAMEKTQVEDIVVLLTSQSMTPIKETAEAILDFKSNTKKKLFAFFLGEKSMQEANKIFEKNKIPYFNRLNSGLQI